MKNKNPDKNIPDKNNLFSSSPDGSRSESSKEAKEAGNVTTARQEVDAEQILQGSLLQMLHELDDQEFILTVPIEEGGDKNE